MNRLDSPTTDNTHTYEPQITIQRWQTTLSIIAISLIVYYGWPYVVYSTTIKRALYESAQSLLPVPILRALQNRAILPPTENSQTLMGDGTMKSLYDGSGVTAAVQRARAFSGLDKLVTTASNTTYSGLHNWDNSCFQNSVLQGLASLDVFRDFIRKNIQKCSANNIDCSTQEALEVFIDQLHQESLAKNTIWPPAALRTMNTWHQQDAQEYFSRIVEVVEKEAGRYAQYLNRSRCASFGSLRTITSVDCTRNLQNESVNTKDLPVLLSPNPLEGLLSESLRCQKCDFSEGLSLMPFTFLTLNLGSRPGYLLEELIDEYTESELIDGIDCDECTRHAHIEPDTSTAVPKGAEPSSKAPKVKSTKAKQSLLARLPQDLVLHVNRSIYDDYGNQRKNTAAVKFHTILEIADDWMEGLASNGESKIHAIYELRCVVTHSGRHDNGHYVAIGKRGKSWYSFNDEIVTNVSEDEVLSRTNVFMLFYEMVETLPILEVPVTDSDVSEAEVD